VNKLPVNGPNPSEWQHGGWHPIRETQIGKEEKEEAPVPGDENKALLRRFFKA
jgi:predicted ester cyclase